MTERTCYRVLYDRGRDTFTVRRDLDFTAFYIDDTGENIQAISTSPEVTIPSARGPSNIEELFGVLLDAWNQTYPDEEPTLLYVDFGDDKAEGFAALRLSEEGWTALHAVGFEETTVEVLEAKPLSPLDQAKADRDRLQEENQRLRHTLGMPLAPETSNYDWGEGRVRELAKEDFDVGSKESDLSVALNAALREVDFGRRRFQGERGQLQALADRLACDVYGLDDAVRLVLVELERVRLLQRGHVPSIVKTIKEEIEPQLIAKLEAEGWESKEMTPLERLRDNLGFILQDLPEGAPGHYFLPGAWKCLQSDVAQLWERHDAAVNTTRTPWNIDRDEISTHVDTDDGQKHLVVALFDFAEQAKDEGDIGFQGHILALYAARYIQWLEDELHRYTVQPVDNEIAVGGETKERWDEDEARKLAFGTEHEEIHEILELAEHLTRALTILDANRVWRVGAEREATRLGHWNLKLHEALEALEVSPIQSSSSDAILGYGCQMCPDCEDTVDEKLENHHPDCIVGQALAGGDWTQYDTPSLREAAEYAVKTLNTRDIDVSFALETIEAKLKGALEGVLRTEGFMGRWPHPIPPRHLCLWLREHAGGDALAKIWAQSIEDIFGDTEAWET